MLAQVRPVTGQTNYPQDLVGSVIDEVERPLLDALLGAPARSSRATRTRSGEGPGAGEVHPDAPRGELDRAC